METLRLSAIRLMAWKWFIPVAVIAAALFFETALASGKYYPLECSYNYPGYCNEGGDCYAKFGDSGVNFMNYCFNVPNNPHTFTDTLMATQTISDQLEMALSGIVFNNNVVGFWLPFSVILNFSMTVLLTILFKFGYFRKN